MAELSRPQPPAQHVHVALRHAAVGWRVGTAVLVVGSLLLAGCASVPTAGGVHREPQAKGANNQAQGEVQFYPEPPGDGATPEQIVRGFLDASGAVEPAGDGVPSLATARDYLAPDQRGKWQPLARVIIFDSYTPLKTDGDTVTFQAKLAGQVDAGTYISTVTDDTFRYNFEVPETEVTDGKREHRIANPPSELLISKSNFEREFAPLNLYFLDPTQHVLVPDPVYLPNRADRATLLVQGLLDGPTRWLSPAVSSAFPDGTELTKRGVRIDAGQALVDLTAPAGKVTKEQQELFAAQLVWTLAQLQISSVSITVDGQTMALPATMTVTNVQPRPADSRSDQPNAYALRAGQLYVLAGTGTSDEKQPVKVAGPWNRIKLAKFAVQPTSPSGTTATIAGIDQTRTKLYVAEGVREAKQVFQGQRLSSLTWDQFGWLWVVDQTSRGSKILAYDPERRHALRVAAPMLTAGSLRVDAIALSRDGTRLAMVTVSRDGRRDAQVASIARGGGGVVLGGPQMLASGLSAQDIAWRGTAELAVLGMGADQPQVYTVSVDGSQLQPHGTVDGATSVTAAPDLPILVGTSNAVWEQSTVGSWERVQQNMIMPRYPG